MSLLKQEHYHAVVIDIRGRFFGSVDGADFMHLIAELFHAGKTRVVVNLSRTDSIDSSGIGTLLAARQKMRAAGGDLRLAGLETRIKALFLMTHLLGAIFDEYPSREEALASYRKHEQLLAA